MGPARARRTPGPDSGGQLARGAERPQPYRFFLALDNDSDAGQLRDTLKSVAINQRSEFVIVPQRPVDILEIIRDNKRYFATENTVVVIVDTYGIITLPNVVTKLPKNVPIYVGIRIDRSGSWEFPGYPNVKIVRMRGWADIAASVIVDFSIIGASSPDRVLFDAVEITDRFSYISNFELRKLASRTNGARLISELSAIGPTAKELTQIALVGNDPDPSALLGPWFDSRRQVALTMAGGCIAGSIAAFIGDATIIATAHGVFSGGVETGAIASLTALTGACGIAAAYYFNKVHKIANKSLRIQNLLNRRRQSP